MFCSKCGTQLADGSRFCSACGAATQDPNGSASSSADSGELCQLVITREKQWFVNNPKVYVTVDQADKHLLENGGSLSLNLPAGRHSLQVTSSLRNTTVDVVLTDIHKLSVKFSKLSGALEVK